MLLALQKNIVVVNGWIVDLYAFDVKILGIFLIQHTACNVWDILSSVALACNVDFVSMHMESVDEVLPETHKLIRYVNLIRDIDRAWGKSCADRLVDIDHVGEVYP